MLSLHPVVVIGAGPAGIAAALSLRDRGVRPLVVDRAESVASSWRNRYDVLKLNTGRQFSHLPKRRYPKGTPTFPSRDQFVDHIDRHACEPGIEVRLNTAVDRIDRGRSGWTLRTSGGDIDARQVVVATGHEHTPYIPEWPGVQGFTGDLLHSCAYRNPGPFQQRRVLVVGAGSSGMEIAHDLATGGVAKVWIAIRTPPNIMLRQGPAGLPGDLIATPLYHAPVRLADGIARAARRRTIGDLTEFGLPIPDEGVFARNARLGQAPTIIDMAVIDAIRDGSVQVVKTIQSFDPDTATDTVRLVDGTELRPDVVICATGYQPGLRPLVGHLGVLNERGAPRVLAPGAAADGLRFLGFLIRPSLIGHVARKSRGMATRIAGELAG